jgi:hypothetical protein
MRSSERVNLRQCHQHGVALDETMLGVSNDSVIHVASPVEPGDHCGHVALVHGIKHMIG